MGRYCVEEGDDASSSDSGGVVVILLDFKEGEEGLDEGLDETFFP